MSTLFACMQKIGLKSLQEYSVDDINRRHFQMQVFLAFLGVIYSFFQGQGLQNVFAKITAIAG